MEQANDMAALCIESRNVGSFESIATDTSQREIPKFGSAAVLPRNDMVYLERCWIKRRWQLTVNGGIHLAPPDSTAFGFRA